MLRTDLKVIYISQQHQSIYGHAIYKDVRRKPFLDIYMCVIEIVLTSEKYVLRYGGSLSLESATTMVHFVDLNESLFQSHIPHMLPQ